MDLRDRNRWDVTAAQGCAVVLTRGQLAIVAFACGVAGVVLGALAVRL